MQVLYYNKNPLYFDITDREPGEKITDSIENFINCAVEYGGLTRKFIILDYCLMYSPDKTLCKKNKLSKYLSLKKEFEKDFNDLFFENS